MDFRLLQLPHSLIAFPNCKINLGLNVIRKRQDNYHDIETVFYPVELADALEIVVSDKGKNEFIATGLLAGDAQNNLCLKAYDLLKSGYPELPFVKMHLHKAIPVGAGLGGGSADALFTLKLLQEKFLAATPAVQLNDIALQLGSDCPFFLYNMPCFASGRGENLVPLNTNLSGFDIVLINPGITINTGWAFGEIKPAIAKKSIRDVIAQPLETWRQDLINDFESPVFKIYPEIKHLKESLYNCGALYTSLSGSGSTVYGIFHKNTAIVPEIPATFFSRVIHLK